MGKMTVRNTVFSSAPIVRAASRIDRSTLSSPKDIVTNGSANRNIAWAMMTLIIKPLIPIVVNNNKNASAIMTGGRIKGAIPNA